MSHFPRVSTQIYHNVQSDGPRGVLWSVARLVILVDDSASSSSHPWNPWKLMMRKAPGHDFVLLLPHWDFGRENENEQATRICALG
jgi:hypothetical protein